MEAIEKSYVPYHVHTHYSLLDSCSTPEDYIKLCVENGHKAISFSEHGKLLNWVSKKKLCEENGVLYIHTTFRVRPLPFSMRCCLNAEKGRIPMYTDADLQIILWNLRELAILPAFWEKRNICDKM